MSPKKHTHERDEIRAKQHPEKHEIAPIFFFPLRNRPLFQRNRAPSKLNIATLTEIGWLRVWIINPFSARYLNPTSFDGSK